MNPDQNASAQQSAPSPAPSSAQKNILMAVLAYVGPLVIVSYITSKDDAFVKYHIKQGGVLFIIEVAVWFFSSMLVFLFPILMLINLGTFILSIIGIINASKGEEKELPIVGKYSKNIPV